MTKEDISALIEREIFAELELQAANNGFTEKFNHYSPLIIAVTILTALRVTNMLIERNIFDNEFLETSLNPYLENLVKYIAENYQANTSGTHWYRRAEENSGKFYKDVLYTHKEVVENWVAERAKDLVDRQAETELEPVGRLNTPFGLNGYKMAEIGTDVYEKKDRYFIILISETNGENKVVSFYKDTLAPNIDFL